MILTEKFHRTYLVLYLFSVATAFFFSSYLKYPIISAVSWTTDDGWCNPKEEGIGEHCFGDYYYPLFLQRKTLPWSDSPNPYPAIALEITRPFQFLNNQFNSRVVLAIYILALLSTLIFSVYFFLKKIKATSAEFTTIILGTIASAPVFVIIDRGNSAILLFPILTLWIFKVRNEEYGKAAILIVVASLLRPQFILLALIFLFLRKPTLFIKTLSGSFIVTSLAFLVYGSNAVSNLTHWVIQIFRYQDYAATAAVFPVNISFSSTINLALRLFSIPAPPVSVKLINLTCFILFVALFYIKFNKILSRI